MISDPLVTLFMVLLGASIVFFLWMVVLWFKDVTTKRRKQH
jgi:hypothetical protein